MDYFVGMTAVAILSGIVGFTLCLIRPCWFVPVVAVGFASLSFSLLPRLLPHHLYWLYPPSEILEYPLGTAFLMTGALAAAYRNSAFRVILQLLLFPLVVYYVLFPALWRAANEQDIRATHYAVRDGVTIQSESYGCVPSSLATILRTYGLEHTEGELSWLLHTTPMGTDYRRLPRVVQSLGADRGLELEFQMMTTEELRQLDEPALLFVYEGRIKHATAVLEVDSETVILGEPLRGREDHALEDYLRSSKWRGLAAIVRESK